MDRLHHGLDQRQIGKLGLHASHEGAQLERLLVVFVAHGRVHQLWHLEQLEHLIVHLRGGLRVLAQRLDLPRVLLDVLACGVQHRNLGRELVQQAATVLQVLTHLTHAHGRLQKGAVVVDRV